MKLGAIIFLWIIHLSALIGIALGYEDFFLPKSPITLLYLWLLLVLFFKLDTLKYFLIFLGCAVVGMLVEWIGVHTGSLFGNYYYGINFGPKIYGIPILIGVNWALLTFTTHVIAKGIFKNLIAVSLTGAALMVGLDFFLEQICDYAGFWHFDGGAGWFNYICWFFIAAILHAGAFYCKLTGDKTISYHIYGVQLFFAIALWILITI